MRQTQNAISHGGAEHTEVYHSKAIVPPQKLKAPQGAYRESGYGDTYQEMHTGTSTWRYVAQAHPIERIRLLSKPQWASFVRIEKIKKGFDIAPLGPSLCRKFLPNHGGHGIAPSAFAEKPIPYLDLV